ncbi:MAG: hypothetical protein OEQ75_05380 [Gemmatimonadota bacterium]|nr:hypothetical protein [Gemmatimonadota bacterium]
MARCQTRVSEMPLREPARIFRRSLAYTPAEWQVLMLPLYRKFTRGEDQSSA